MTKQESPKKHVIGQSNEYLERQDAKDAEKARIAALESDVETLKAEVKKLQAKLCDLAARVSSLEEANQL